MKITPVAAFLAISSSSLTVSALSSASLTTPSTQSTTSLQASVDRRNFGKSVFGIAAGTIAGSLVQPTASNAEVFFDPAMYGDQELRVGAVDSVRESVRRAILKNPKLAPSFYQLALLDGLSYNAQTKQFGPDGSIMKIVLSSKDTDEFTKRMQEAALAIIESEKNLRRKNAVSIPDAIAIAGAEAIESIGGPVLTVQLGRADTPKDGPVNTKLPLDLLTGRRSNEEVLAAFKSAGLTDREMTVLLTGLMTLESVEKSRSLDDWRASAKPKYRERGKMGRMSEYKRITDEDIAQAELEADPEYEDPDDGWYIADSFGDRDSRFGERLGKEEISEKTFNKYVKALNDAAKKKGNKESSGWIGDFLTDKDSLATQVWVTKYAGSNLSYIKDLSVAYNSLTQLGAVYTGGKYENLLKNRPRKSLNDDGLNLF